MAGIVSLGKNDENLLGDNFETISFYFMFCDMMVTVACSNFCHFGKQVGVNSEKTFKGRVLIQLMNIFSEAKKKGHVSGSKKSTSLEVKICQTSSSGVIFC